MSTAKGAPSRNLLVDIIEEISGMGRGLTISPTVGGQENGAAAGPLHWAPPTATQLGLTGCVASLSRAFRALGEEGAVGMDSSCGSGAAVLLIGHEVPSGARCSGAILRRKGGAHSPASRRWSASASSIASTSSDVVVGFRMPTA
ncbi:hypothetical protein PO909_027729 [Leuciscus waleckii]